MLYFIEAVGPGHIKIGSTDKPVEVRLATLQTGNSYPLRVLGTIPGGHGEEAALHRQFAGLHFRGEWFRAGPRLLAFLREKTPQYKMIENLDLALGKKLVRTEVITLPRSNSLFSWASVLDDVALRLRAGQPEQTVADACPVTEDEVDCFYCGWTVGKSSVNRGPLCHLLFVQECRLFRCSGWFRPYFPLAFLPRDFMQSFPSHPREVYSVCRRIWWAFMAGWLKDEDRLYL